MKSIVIVLAICLVAGSRADLQSRIINGTASTGAPYYAHIQYTNAAGSGFFGGGSLISPTHVLTAAHNIVTFNLWNIGLGSTTASQLQRWTTTINVVHPLYNTSTRNNDIGILTLLQAIQYTATIQPIALPATQVLTIPYFEEQGRISGFGWQVEQGLQSPLLLTTFQRVINDVQCQLSFIFTPPNHFCAFDNRQSNICMGDLGGGFVVSIRGVPTLLGIASAVNGQCGTINPSLYTRVAVYRDWIRTLTNV